MDVYITKHLFPLTVQFEVQDSHMRTGVCVPLGGGVRGTQRLCSTVADENNIPHSITLR